MDMDFSNSLPQQERDCHTKQPRIVFYLFVSVCLISLLPSATVRRRVTTSGRGWCRHGNQKTNLLLYQRDSLSARETISFQLTVFININVQKP